MLQLHLVERRSRFALDHQGQHPGGSPAETADNFGPKKNIRSEFQSVSYHHGDNSPHVQSRPDTANSVSTRHENFQSHNNVNCPGLKFRLA